MNASKYKKLYTMPPSVDMSWTAREYPDHAPIWCSVDLRDGNQSLIVPMNLDEKIKFFHALVDVGFKEIEVGFPSASETEYAFVRTLAEENLIPDDVTIQVLTQAREHILKKTFDSLDGIKNAIIGIYTPTSQAQRTHVLRRSKEEVRQMASDAAWMLKELTESARAPYRFKFTPESFTGTEPEYALDVCNTVLDIWKPGPQRKIIINLPGTMQLSMPHIYAAQVAYMSQNLNYRENVILSLHTHNDRGCSVADTEMGLLAGADRVEGTLFGNGERTGNVDLITVAMNMLMLGVDPHLDFSDLPRICELYERITDMSVPLRQPYSGSLVFAAFSGSHQDAIAKGLKDREKNHTAQWDIPYLTIDPQDVGRKYDTDVIRINSQSGKGGISYMLERAYGLLMPDMMREEFGYFVKSVSDRLHKELKAKEIYDLFVKEYVNLKTPFSAEDFSVAAHNGLWQARLKLLVSGDEHILTGQGNGPSDAMIQAVKEHCRRNIKQTVCESHELNEQSDPVTIVYMGISEKEGTAAWGAGIDKEPMTADLKAFISALNRLETKTAI